MGKFTNFVNMLDLCAVSVPVGWWENKNGRDLPFGVTVIGQAGKIKRSWLLERSYGDAEVETLGFQSFPDIEFVVVRSINWT